MITDLRILPGDFSSTAFGINNKSQVVGVSCDKTGTVRRAFLWQEGVMTDLNTLVPTDTPLFLIVGGTLILLGRSLVKHSTKARATLRLSWPSRVTRNTLIAKIGIGQSPGASEAARERFQAG